MSAAVTRAKERESGARELTPPSKTISAELGGRPAIEVPRVAEAELAPISEHGITPLMRAARDGLAGTVQALLDRGAEVNAKRSDGFNALALAAFFGHSQVVWLLLENGADLGAVNRSETLPEMWADARGFVEIGDALREARAARHLEAASLRTAVIHEPARFSRPGEQENLEQTADAEHSGERPVVADAADSETILAMEPAPLAEEKAENGSESSSESSSKILPSAEPEHAQPQPITPPSPRALKTLSEIKDPPPLVVPEFHPGSVFVARITSSRKNLLAVTVAVLLLCGGTAALLIPPIRKSLAGWRQEAARSTTSLPTQTGNPGSGSAVNGTVETPAVTTESTAAPAQSNNEVTTGTAVTTNSVEPTQFESAEKPAESSAGSAGSDSRAHPGSSPSTDSTVAEPSGNKREFTAATSLSRSGASSRRQSKVSRVVKPNQQNVNEEQPKPAALSVEMSRSRSGLTPARNPGEGAGSQALPLGITSGKPKSKVIQWP